jgi:Sec-independent protein translocase protein TatA
MYIGIGTVVLILVIVLVIFFLRGRVEQSARPNSA